MGRNNSTTKVVSAKALLARNVYLRLGSIKKTAKRTGESRSNIREWVKDLINTPNRNRPLPFASRSDEPSYLCSGTIHTRTRTIQRTRDPNKVVISNKGSFEVIKSKAWGQFLVPVEDPRHRTLTLKEINGIRLPNTFKKIPAEMWSNWIDLCFHYCSGAFKNSEVQILLCRKENDLDQWRMLVPKQVVSGISVQAITAECIDLSTGESFTCFPPEGWLHAGSSHSHNTMDAFFSQADDESEISVPGIHIVVGNINKKQWTYSFKSSIVVRKLRKCVDFDDIVDHITDNIPDNTTFHPKVHNYIHY